MTTSSILTKKFTKYNIDNMFGHQNRFFNGLDRVSLEITPKTCQKLEVTNQALKFTFLVTTSLILVRFSSFNLQNAQENKPYKLGRKLYLF